MRLTRIGGPTVLAEFDGWRILIDPTFDPAGRRYSFALGTSSTKTAAPTIEPDALGPIDIALVSHDQHADNLDDAGRAFLPHATHVLTTASGAKRLGLPNVTGLRAGESVHIEADGKPALEVAATPGRHGPPLTTPLVGDVVGFAISRAGESRTQLWVTGDTVLYRALRATARALDVDVAVVNVGGVRFPQTGPLRYTMTGAEAVRLIAELEPRVAVPAHYEGWSHFRDGVHGIRTAVDSAPPAVRARIRMLETGEQADLSEQRH